MKTSTALRSAVFRTWSQIFHGGAERRARSGVEALESRIAPATFTGAGTTLTIDLNSASELVTFSTNGTTITAVLTGGVATDGGGTGGNVTGFGTGNAAITSAPFTAINVIDSSTGNAVAFATSAGNYPQSFDIALDAPTAGGVTFTGNTTFAFATSQEVTRISSTGSITQTAGTLTTTGTGALNLASTGGLINLPTATNAISNSTALGLSTTGANAITIVNGNATQLGDVSADTGSLTLTLSGNLTQKAGTTIESDGALTVNIANGNRNITLANEGNRIAGAVTFAETGGDIISANFRNAHEAAQMPVIPALATTNDINTLTLFSDNNGVVLPAMQPNNLSVTAGGDITQSGAIVTTGTGTFRILGDFGIALTDAGNNFGTSVAFNAPQSTQLVQVSEADTIVLGASTLGRGAFSATALAGLVTQSSAFVQDKGGTASFAVAPGQDVVLNSNSNRFTGGVTITGADLVSFVNADPQADFSQLTLPGSVTDLTVNFVTTSIALPSLSLTNLAVTAQGIAQQAGSTINLTGTALFNGGSFRVTLANAGNDFTTVAITNFDRNDVVVTDVDDLAFGASTLGTGRLIVTAGGAISQTGAITQSANGIPGDVLLTSTGGAITLGSANIFRGAVSATVGGASGISLTNTGVGLILGDVTTVTGALAITSNPGITQDPNSVLVLGGTSSFTSTADIELTNRLNNFAGAVSLNAANASLRTVGAVVLGASVVSNSLGIETGGAAGHSITQTGAVTGNSAATLDAGAGNITLTTAANNFASVGLFSMGTAVAITDTSNLAIRTSQLGGGTLTITTGGNITSGGGSLVQTSGTGTITLDTPAGSNITLNNSGNVLRGMVNVLHSNDVNFRSRDDMAFAPASSVTGDLIATAGGAITLPNDLSQLDSLTLSANLTTISSDVTLSAGILDVTGNLILTGNRILSVTGGGMNIRNGLTAGGSLTLNLPAGGVVQLSSGDWNQGANPLTINGAGADLTLGGGGAASFNMTSGTISLADGDVNVLANTVFRVGGTTAAETVTIANGTGVFSIAANAALEIGLGVTNDQVSKTGTGAVTIAAGAILRGSSLAGATTSPVLTTQSVINGRFADSVDANGAPLDFFAGSDILTPTYTLKQLSVQAGGITAPTGSISGFLPDGDQYTISSSLGATAGLALVENPDGSLAVVVRNNTAAGPAKLDFSTSGGGDGRLVIDGLMVHSPGAVSIAAPDADFTGLFTTTGTLASLTAHDLGRGSSLSLSGGGPVGGKTSITANELLNSTIVLSGALDKLKVVSASGNTRITADQFGSITTTGAPLGSNPNIPGVPNPGDFLGNITSTTAADGVVLGSASIKGTVQGNWDLRGSVGKVTAGDAEGWNLGVAASSIARNGGLLTDVKSITLGQVVTSMRIEASGMVAALTAGQIGGSGNTFIANSFGTIKVTGNAALGLVGNVEGLILTANGHTSGTALKSLTVAGALAATLNILDGDVGSITVGRTIDNTTITARDTNGHGNIKSITAAEWDNTDVDARTIGTVKATGNFKGGLLGNFTDSTITVRGNAKGAGLGMFTTQGNVAGSSFDIQNGNLPTFKVGRQLSTTNIMLTDPAFGNLGTIQAGDWSGVVVVAETIGTVASVGALASGPASPLLPGHIASSTITAYLDNSGTPAIGKLTTKGDFTSSDLDAGRGVGSLLVGRSISNSDIVADDAANGVLAVGRIGTLTAGAMDDSRLSAETLGRVKFTGFALPDSSSASFQFGDVTSSTLLVHGATPAKPVGIDSFAVARHFTGMLVAPFGIKTLTVGGESLNAQVIADHPTTPAAGFIGSFTTGELESSSVRAGSIGTMKIAGSDPFALLGNFLNSQIAVTSGTPIPGGLQAIGTLSISGDMVGSVLDAPATVGKIDVLGRITSDNGPVRVLAGYAPGSKLGSLTAASWGGTANATTTDLVSQSVGSFMLKGHPSRGIAGALDQGFIDILGNSSGIGLGTFLATGTVSDSLIRVSDGDVTSFTAQRLSSSDLLVGFRFVKTGDLTATPTAAQWSTTNHKIGTFKTTAPFDLADVEDSASFVDSNVIAGILGSITISGVNPDTIASTAFGVAFRTSAGAAAAGVVKTNGVAIPLTAPATSGQFNYLGLAG